MSDYDTTSDMHSISITAHFRNTRGKLAFVLDIVKQI